MTAPEASPHVEHWATAVRRAVVAAIARRTAGKRTLAKIVGDEHDASLPDPVDEASAALDALARESLEGFALEAQQSSPGLDAATAFGEAYQRVLAHRPQLNDAGEWALVRHPRSRKRSGSFYTPAALVERLLDVSLDPLIDEALAASAPELHETTLLALRILDPACGDGRLLRAAAKRLAGRLAEVRAWGYPVTPPAVRDALRDVSSRCVCGIDRDWCAVTLARFGLHLDGATEARRAVQHGDAFDADLATLDRDAAEQGGFDLVLGNPPFANAIEGDLPAEIVSRARLRGTLLRGTADLASYFLELGLHLTRPGGRTAMIQPRPTFVSPATEAFRERLRDGFRSNAFYVPERSNLFRGALVFAGVVVLGPLETCRVSRDADPERVAWRETRVVGSQWWDALYPDEPNADDATAETVALEEVCDVSASLTTAEAYELRAALVDSSRGKRLKLATTGLIDPGVCLWGQRVCRFLKSDYRHPRVAEAKLAGASLQRRATAARRPKVLVAGLSKRVEAFCDANGEYLGGVSTFAITHPADDVGFLQRLTEYLGAARVDERFNRLLSAGAVGGGDFVMTKRFLKGLPIPKSLLTP